MIIARSRWKYSVFFFADNKFLGIHCPKDGRHNYLLIITVHFSPPTPTDFSGMSTAMSPARISTNWNSSKHCKSKKHTSQCRKESAAPNQSNRKRTFTVCWPRYSVILIAWHSNNSVHGSIVTNVPLCCRDGYWSMLVWICPPNWKRPPSTRVWRASHIWRSRISAIWRRCFGRWRVRRKQANWIWNRWDRWSVHRYHRRHWPAFSMRSMRIAMVTSTSRSCAVVLVLRAVDPASSAANVSANLETKYISYCCCIVLLTLILILNCSLLQSIRHR